MMDGSSVMKGTSHESPAIFNEEKKDFPEQGLCYEMQNISKRSADCISVHNRLG
jgi:hypothetical protein